MDAPNGPVCGCGRPARRESGNCGLPVRQPVLLTKTTVLEGHYASGDCECFCFDTHHPEHDHYAALRTWLQTHEDVTDIPAELVYDTCLYPNALLPDGVERRKGRWTITVAFEPEPM